MALRTLGSNANNSLNALVVGFNDLIPADMAAINVALRGDPPGYSADGNVTTAGLSTGQGSVRPRINQPYQQTGILYVPNRGFLRLKRGDFVCWDSTTGWPIVLSGDAAANGPYTHS